MTALTRNEQAVVDGARVLAAAYSSTADLTEAYRDAAGAFVHLPLASEGDRRIFARNIVDAVRTAKPDRVVLPPAVLGSPPPATVRYRRWSGA